MAGDNLEGFQNVFNGGNRSHLYNVQMNYPTGISGLGSGSSQDVADQMSRFTVRAVNLPPSQVNPIRVPYRGRILKWPGDRVYFPWTFRVLDDNARNGTSSVWKNLQKWSNYINDHETNRSSDDWEGFTTTWTIDQVGYGSEGNDTGDNPVKRVQLVDCWPTSIGPITMDSNAIDTLVEFTVTVEYSYFTVDGVN
tara:strand:- start:1029 stop:1613 length:585 start_codon:yes stop_codon:yes gene_type:complete